jgi:hypothetical protein
MAPFVKEGEKDVIFLSFRKNVVTEKSFSPSQPLYERGRKHIALNHITSLFRDAIMLSTLDILPFCIGASA